MEQRTKDLAGRNIGTSCYIPWAPSTDLPPLPLWTRHSERSLTSQSVSSPTTPPSRGRGPYNAKTNISSFSYAMILACL